MERKKRAAVLFSGGKDSCLALHKIWMKYDVKFLLSMLPEAKDSFMFHKPDEELLEKQANRLGVSLIVKRTKGEKEKELKNLKKLLEIVKKEVDVVVIGGIASSYQGKRIKKLANEIGLKVDAPLWDFDEEKLWNELMRGKFKVIITKISCEGLSKDWIGKVIGKKELQKLRKLAEKYKFRLDFEGGEAETAVLFMPEFKNQIKLGYDVKSEGRYRHFIKIKRIK